MQVREEKVLFEAIEAYKNGNGEKATDIYEATKKYAYSIIHQQVSRFKSQGVLTRDVNAFAEDEDYREENDIWDSQEVNDGALEGVTLPAYTNVVWTFRFDTDFVSMQDAELSSLTTNASVSYAY